MPIDDVMDKLRTTSSYHVRLEHFPLHVAQELWARLADERVWL